jgi:hypothetical protein
LRPPHHAAYARFVSQRSAIDTERTIIKVNFPTKESCRVYVDAELDRTVRAIPGWQADAWSGQDAGLLNPHVRPAAMLWRIGRHNLHGWYTLEARIDEGEFLFWFGNHQVGAGGLHWILCPAIHVAFAALHPAQDATVFQYTLGDVLTTLIDPTEQTQPPHRLEMNDFSVT